MSAMNTIGTATFGILRSSVGNNRACPGAYCEFGSKSSCDVQRSVCYARSATSVPHPTVRYRRPGGRDLGAGSAAVRRDGQQKCRSEPLAIGEGFTQVVEIDRNAPDGWRLATLPACSTSLPAPLPPRKSCAKLGASCWTQQCGSDGRLGRSFCYSRSRLPHALASSSLPIGLIRPSLAPMDLAVAVAGIEASRRANASRGLSSSGLSGNAALRLYGASCRSRGASALGPASIARNQRWPEVSAPNSSASEPTTRRANALAAPALRQAKRVVTSTP